MATLRSASSEEVIGMVFTAPPSWDGHRPPTERGPTGPPFAEVVDREHAFIRARGSLTVQGADLIRGTAEMLHRSGHDLITIDLRDVALADQGALDLLQTLADELQARSVRL